VSALEKMARAIANAEHRAFWGVDMTEEGWSWMYAQPYLDQAKAALQSLKDLDEGTVEAMAEPISAMIVEDRPTSEIVRGVIDLILKGAE
jgi:hypothetical protein